MGQTSVRAGSASVGRCGNRVPRRFLPLAAEEAAAGGTTLTVYQQNLGTTKMPHPGESVRLTWEPEYTFAVRPASVPITSEEEERE